MRRILTAIGEIGITAKSRDFLFRPSLYAMSLLDDPVASFAEIHQDGGTSRELERARFLAAIEVMQVCCEDDISALIGCTGSRPDRWIPGLINHEKIIIIASSLIRHGLVGPQFNDDEIGERKKDFSEKFDPSAIVAMAIAHLGMGEAEAWSMTVSGFVMAMRAKFPPPPRTRPNAKELDSMMDWLDKVNAAEKAQKNG